MTRDEIEKRRRELLEAEKDLPPRWWWCSFVKDGKFAGVSMVEACGPATALEKTRMFGINPGGEVMVYEMPAGPAEEFRYKLITSKEELEAIGAERMVGRRHEKPDPEVG